MAVIAVTPAQVSPCFTEGLRVRNYVANVALTAGDPVYLMSTGKVALADANGSGLQQFLGIVLQTVGAGEATSVCEEGELYGFTLAGDYGARVYLSDTVGRLDDAAGTMTVVIGQIRPIVTVGGFNKMLYVSSDPTKVWA
jgi:hypothetical protein